MIGLEEKDGRTIDLQSIHRAECSSKWNLRFFHLSDGQEILSPQKFGFGSHWIQCFIAFPDGDITECMFKIEIVRPNSSWPIEDDKVLPSDLIDADALIELPGEEHNFGLGSLSLTWESGQQGPGVISSGEGDPGGISYGLYQISMKQGYLEDFLLNEGQAFFQILGQYEPGSHEFDMAWKAIADVQPIQFQKAQHEYIRRSHYMMQARRLNRKLGMNINDYSNVLKDVLWSTAVQHGPYNDVFYNALARTNWKDMSEKEIISRIYKERSRSVNGYLSYFPRVGPKWKRNLIKRFEKEEKMALDRLDREERMTALPGTSVALPPEPSDSSASSTTLSGEVVLATQYEPVAYAPSEKPWPKSKITSREAQTVIQKDVASSQEIGNTAVTGGEQWTPEDDAEVEPADQEAPPIPSARSNLFTYKVLFVVLNEPGKQFNELTDLGPISEDPFMSDKVRYLLGEAQTLDHARSLKNKVADRGFKAAQIAVYQKGKLKKFVD